jgi:solute carrier family 36 (proton-coupled amino acid transporter)
VCTPSFFPPVFSLTIPLSHSHDIYKWQSHQRQQVVARSRAASFSGGRSAPVDPAFEHIHEPGGFRRNYVLLRANEQGAEGPVVLNNFIDFLFIFGHFVSDLPSVLRVICFC